MKISARIEPIDRDLQVLFKEDLSPQARSAALAAFAKEQLAEAQAQNQRAIGRVPPHETIVDQRRGAPVESVKPDGTIVFEFELLDDLFAWIGEQLVRHAPVLTGRYRSSFLFFADGVEVEPGAKPPAASEYVFVNSVPYARKIERGHSDQAPNGVFEAVAALAKKRFGNLASIKFSYRAIQGGAMVPYAPVQRTVGRDKRGRFTATGRDRTAQRQEHSSRQPAIVINLR